MNIRSANKLRSILSSLEDRCVAIMASDIAKRRPKLFTVRKIKKELSGSEALNKNDAAELFKNLMVKYTELSVSARSVAKNDRKNAIYDVVKNGSSVSTVLAAKMECRAKLKELRNLSGVFYICSEFSDCAVDHREYQGKLYVMDDWTEKVRPEMIDTVAAFIKKHGIMTVQEVCFSYPYLITRPNCRHRLTSVSIKDALAGDYEPERFEKEGVDGLYLKYCNRLKRLLELKKTMPTKEIENDIRKTRMLIRHRAVKLKK